MIDARARVCYVTVATFQWRNVAFFTREFSMKKMATLLFSIAALAARAQTAMPPAHYTVGTVIEHGSVAGQEGWHLFDELYGDSTTAPGHASESKWCAPRTTTPVSEYGGWVVYQFPDGEKWALTNYVFWTANDVAGRDPYIWQIEGTNDLAEQIETHGATPAAVNNATWVPVDVRTNATTGSGWARLSPYSFSCEENKTPYNAYRLHILQNYNESHLQFGEWQMQGYSGIEPGNFDILSLSATDAGWSTVDAPFRLTVRAGSADVHVDWGTSPTAFTETALVGNFSESTNFTSTLTGLMPDTPHWFRHRAENGTEAFTSAVARAFTTLGKVSFPQFFAYNEGETLYTECNVSHYGVAPVTVTLWLGKGAGNLDSVQSWGNVASPGTCHGTVTGCEINALYYYQFTAEYVYKGKTYFYESSVKTFRTLAPAAIRTLYWAGGSADIANGTPIPTAYEPLSGTWNKTLKNWSVDEFGSKYVAWEDGADRTAWFRAGTGGGCSEVVLASDVMLNRIVVDVNNIYGLAGIELTAGGRQDITLAGHRPEIHVAGNSNLDTKPLRLMRGVELIAPDGFIKGGAGSLNVQTPLNLATGKVTVGGGWETHGLILQDAAGFAGAMAGVPEFDIWNNGELRVHLTDQGADNNRLNDNAVVRLRGNGAFNSNGDANGHDTIRKIVLENHGELRGLNAALGRYTLSQGIDRGPFTNGTLCLRDTASSGTFVHPNVVVANDPGTGAVLPWAYTPLSYPVRINPSSKAFEIMAGETVNVSGDVRDWLPGKHYRVTGGLSNALTNNLSLASLGFYLAGATTLNIEPDQTLDIAPGAITFNSNEKSINGGAVTSSSGVLHVSTHEGSHFIGSKLTGAAMDFIKSGQGTIIFRGTNVNDYTGVTHINSGTLRLGKSENTRSIPGELVIHYGGAVDFEAWNTFATHSLNPASRLLIREGGRMNFSAQGSHQTYNNVVRLEGGVLQFSYGSQNFHYAGPGPGLVFGNGGRFHYTHSGTTVISIQTDVLCEPGASNQVVFISDNPHFLSSVILSKNPAHPPQPVVTRTFEVNKAAGLAPGVPEVSMGMQFEITPYEPVDLLKTGGGDLALERVSGLYEGRATVRGGSLFLNAYATQSVHFVTSGHWPQNLSDFASTAGLHPGQAINYTPNNGRRFGWIYSMGPTTVAIPQWPMNDPHEKIHVTFLSSGPLGWADVYVEDGGTLGGTGGSGGNVYVEAGGTFRVGTPANRVSEFAVGMGGSPGLSGENLVFEPGAVWQVDVDATVSNTSAYFACGRVNVAGDITLAGEIVPVFHNAAKARPKGVWTIATYGNAATGKMSAPQGCKVLVDDVNKVVKLVSVEAGTLFLIR